MFHGENRFILFVPRFPSPWTHPPPPSCRQYSPLNGLYMLIFYITLDDINKNISSIAATYESSLFKLYCFHQNTEWNKSWHEIPSDHISALILQNKCLCISITHITITVVTETSVLTHHISLTWQNNLFRCFEISFIFSPYITGLKSGWYRTACKVMIKLTVFGKSDPSRTITTSYAHKQKKLIKTNRWGKQVCAAFLLTVLQLW